MPWFAADLHIHSCLSPCGELSASPKAIVSYAMDCKLDLIALTDHNSALNTLAFAEHAKRNKLQALYGIEASSAEDVHCLCLFDDLNEVMDFGTIVYEHLAEIPNDPDYFGDQVQVDENDDIIAEVPKLLISTTDLGISDLCALAQDMRGMCIPAHVDRSTYSCLSQLGYIPPAPFDALEIRDMGTRLEQLNPGGPKRTDAPSPGLPARFPAIPREPLNDSMIEAALTTMSKRGLMPSLAWQEALVAGRLLPTTLIANSDAHAPEYIGQRQTLFWAQRPDFAGLGIAIARGWCIPTWLRSSILAQ